MNAIIINGNTFLDTCLKGLDTLSREATLSGLFAFLLERGLL